MKIEELFPESATGMNWESPIKLSLVEQCENKLEQSIVSCLLKYDISVEVEELKKALRYSRDSYKKGFNDAMMQCSREPEHCRWYNAKKCVPPEDTALLVTILKTDESNGLKEPYTAEAVYIAGVYIGRDYLGGHFVYSSDIVAWMLYPQPYTFEE